MKKLFRLAVIQFIILVMFTLALPHILHAVYWDTGDAKPWVKRVELNRYQNGDIRIDVRGFNLYKIDRIYINEKNCPIKEKLLEPGGDAVTLRMDASYFEGSHEVKIELARVFPLRVIYKSDPVMLDVSSL